MEMLAGIDVVYYKAKVEQSWIIKKYTIQVKDAKLNARWDRIEKDVKLKREYL